MNAEHNGQNGHEEHPGDVDLTSYALNEMNEEQAAQVRAQIAENKQASRVVEQTRRLADAIEQSVSVRLPHGIAGLEQQIEEALAQPSMESEIVVFGKEKEEADVSPSSGLRPPSPSRGEGKHSASGNTRTVLRMKHWSAIAAGLLVVVGGYALWQMNSVRELAVQLSADRNEAISEYSVANKRIVDNRLEMRPTIQADSGERSQAGEVDDSQLQDLQSGDASGFESGTAAPLTDSFGVYSIAGSATTKPSTPDGEIRLIEEQIDLKENLARSVERIERSQREQEGQWGSYDAAGRSMGFRPQITPAPLNRTTVGVPDGGTLMLGGIKVQPDSHATQLPGANGLQFPANQHNEFFVYRNPSKGFATLDWERLQLSEDYVTRLGLLPALNADDVTIIPGNQGLDELLAAYATARGESEMITESEGGERADGASELDLLRGKVRHIADLREQKLSQLGAEHSEVQQLGKELAYYEEQQVQLEAKTQSLALLQQAISVVNTRGPVGNLDGQTCYNNLVQLSQLRDQMTAILGASSDPRVAAIEAEINRCYARLIALRDAETNPANEQYELPPENAFVRPILDQARSTFAIDVDTAAYANTRRFITGGQLPPPNAVRVEELINYFDYNYPQPTDGRPFSVDLEVAGCPWNESHQLLRIGLQGLEVARDDRPASNLVFLIDVSGSMADSNKLPLLQRSMLMLVDNLTENDRVTIVTYAGNAGLRLEPTSGDQKQHIRDVINGLTSGGSTHGSAGIQMAYELASQHYIEEGVNRVILATDGDLNVGVTADDQLVRLIKNKARLGIFLSVLGFGTGNLKDAKLEKLADNGNGHYSYIDSIAEARKVLVDEMSGSLVTIAKDVKIQVEFNPAEVWAYRLIGYENRALQNEDFDNDAVDAGDIGAGHTVTALYELVPVGAEDRVDADPVVEPLKYQQPRSEVREQDEDVSQNATSRTALTEAARSGELVTVALRYKQPDLDESERIEFTVKDSELTFDEASTAFRFAASVASFGMLLRHSRYAGSWDLSQVEMHAAGALGKDEKGRRSEFVDLVRQTARIAGH